jgi:glyceraldehyde 3-phosphate dehydrogenase
MEILGRRIGVKKAIMTTVHAYTASQALVDTAHSRPRRGRAGGANLVPTSTGAAAATARALPEYRGKFDGVPVRAPVPVGSVADIVCLTVRATTVDEVNRLFVEEAENERYRGILGVTADPLVSSNIIKDPRASVVDLGMTQVVDGDLLKVMSWYDNEWGYSSQLVREALRMPERGIGRAQRGNDDRRVPAFVPAFRPRCARPWRVAVLTSSVSGRRYPSIW